MKDFQNNYEMLIRFWKSFYMLLSQNSLLSSVRIKIHEREQVFKSLLGYHTKLFQSMRHVFRKLLKRLKQVT